MRLIQGLKVGICGFALIGAPLLAVTACSPKATEAAAPAAPKVDWKALVTDWIESDFKANPDSAVYVGRHEFDGQFPDWSAAGLKAELDRLHTWKSKIEAVDPASLDDTQKFERSYFLAVLDGRLFWHETADWPHKNPQFYAIDPAVYLDRQYADLPTRMKAYTKWAGNVPAVAAAIKANIAGPSPKAYVDIALHTFGPMADFLKSDVPKVFKGQGDAAAQADFKKANDAAIAALTDLDAHFKSLQKTQVDAFAMGPDLFAQMLKATEIVDTPLDELQKMGEADLNRNIAALTEACKTFAPGKTIQQCTAKADADKPPGDSVVYAKQQLEDLRKFVIDHNVVSVPNDDQAHVKYSPPYNDQNGAYIDPAAPFEAKPAAYYNIAAPNPKWTAKQRADYVSGKADLLFTSVHEVWPGHFLQFLHSNQSKSMFGKVYVGYAFAEGWAHYAEEMMWDEGLGNGDPETHIGQLTNATLRNVRFLSAIGMHAKGMTLEQSKKMFVERGYQDEKTAEQQAARGAYDPAYLNYTMGKLMIRKLRNDWCAKKGAKPDDKACWKDFHDAFLAYGGPPIPLVRGAMMGEAPKSVF